MIKDFFLAFIPLFVAFDAIGTLPIFVFLTSKLRPDEKHRIIVQSLWTAFALAIGFIFLGRTIFFFLGITISDFMIAGGIILFCIAIMDLLKPGKERRVFSKDMGVVPLGTPLVVGPAVLTTSLMLVDHYGFVITLMAVLSNILLVGIVFSSARQIIHLLGQSGARALSKLMALLLAAIAVMMIRKGITPFLS